MKYEDIKVGMDLYCWSKDTWGLEHYRMVSVARVTPKGTFVLVDKQGKEFDRIKPPPKYGSDWKLERYRFVCEATKAKAKEANKRLGLWIKIADSSSLRNLRQLAACGDISLVERLDRIVDEWQEIQRKSGQ